jgi:hypothetical protein
MSRPKMVSGQVSLSESKSEHTDAVTRQEQMSRVVCTEIFIRIGAMAESSNLTA